MAAPPSLFVTYTRKPDGTLILVSLQDAEHRIHKILWEYGDNDALAEKIREEHNSGFDSVPD